MTQLSIELPEDVRLLANEDIKRGSYATFSDYVVALIRERRERVEAEAELLRERLSAGPAKLMTDADFDGIRARLEQEIARRKGA